MSKTVASFDKLQLREVSNYTTHPTFTEETQLVDKKYVDDSLALPDHNDTLNIQGGTASEYYHLTSAELSALNALIAPPKFEDDFFNMVRGEWKETGTGTIDFDDDINGSVEFTTGATTDDECGIDFDGVYNFNSSKKPYIEVAVKVGQLVTTYAEVGLKGSDADDYIKFFVDTAGMGYWTLAIYNGSTASSLVTSEALSTDEVILKFVWKDANTINVYVNGVQAGGDIDVTSSKPTNNLQPYYYIQALDDVAVSMKSDYIKIWQER